jgi:hypothetical protein
LLPPLAWIVLLFYFEFCCFSNISSEGDDHGNSTADTTHSSGSSEHDKNELNHHGHDENEKQPVHKWPIRPGVHVHVNGLHALNNSGNANSSNPAEITGFSYGARNSGGSSAASDSASEKERGVDEEDLVKTTVARGTSTSDMMMRNGGSSHNETMASAIPNSNNSNAIIYFLSCFLLGMAYFLFSFCFCTNLAMTTSTPASSAASKAIKPKRKQQSK